MGQSREVPTAESGRSNKRTAPRIVLADDHAGVLAETRFLLEPYFSVVAEACDGSALVETVRATSPDAVIADVEMPGMNGIEAGREIVSRGLCGAIVMLSMYNDPQLVQRALRAGIRGYVLKDDAGDDLIRALETVLAGGCYLSRGVAGAGRL